MDVRFYQRKTLQAKSSAVTTATVVLISMPPAGALRQQSGKAKAGRNLIRRPRNLNSQAVFLAGFFFLSPKLESVPAP